MTRQKPSTRPDLHVALAAVSHVLSVLPSAEQPALVEALEQGFRTPEVETSATPTLHVLERVLPRVASDRVAASYHLDSFLSRPAPTPRRSVDEWELTLADQGFDAPRIVSAVVHLEALPHVKLVWSFANRRQYASPNHTAEDLLSFGWEGLCSALRKYDPTRHPLSTYVARRISGAMQDGVRKEHHLPKRLHTELNSYLGEREHFIDTHGREPSDEELAAAVGVTVERIRGLVHFQDPRSLDEIRAEAPESVEVADPVDVESLALAQVESENLQHALLSLPDTERKVLWGLHVEERTLTQVAEGLELEPSEVRRLRDTAIANLRRELAAA